MASKSVRIPKRFSHLGKLGYIYLRSTIYHEAGHTALHLEYGRDIDKVTIEITTEKDGEHSFWGHVDYNTYSVLKYDDVKGRKKNFSELAMANIAGFASEIYLDCLEDEDDDDEPELDENVFQSANPEDYQSALDACMRVASNDQEAYRLFDKCMDRTMKLITTPRIWQRIDKIAKALLKSPNLTLENSDLKRMFPELFSPPLKGAAQKTKRPKKSEGK